MRARVVTVEASQGIPSHSGVLNDEPQKAEGG